MAPNILAASHVDGPVASFAAMQYDLIRHDQPDDHVTQLIAHFRAA